MSWPIGALARPAEPFATPGAIRCRAEPRPAVRCRGAAWRPLPLCAQRRPFTGVVRQAPQLGDRHFMVRFRPGRAGIDLPRILRGNQAIVDQRGAVRIHERHVAGPAGRDHRPAQQHRFGEHQAEALATMQRQHDIRCGGQRVQVGSRQCSRLQPHVGRAVHGTDDAGEVIRRVLAIADLHQQDPIAAIAECGTKRRDRRQRVLAFERGREIERHQYHDCLFRQPERVAGQRGRLGSGNRQRKRHDAHAPGQQRLHGSGDEVGRHPDLVHEPRAGPPFRRHRRQLPQPVADDPPAAHQRARQTEQHPRQQRRVHVQKQRRPMRRQLRGDGEILGVGRQQIADIDRPGRQSSLPDAARDQPCALTQTGGTRHLACDRDAMAGRRRDWIDRRRDE